MNKQKNIRNSYEFLGFVFYNITICHMSLIEHFFFQTFKPPEREYIEIPLILQQMGELEACTLG